jgi:hypothetical protein
VREVVGPVTICWRCPRKSPARRLFFAALAKSGQEAATLGRGKRARVHNKGEEGQGRRDPRKALHPPFLHVLRFPIFSRFASIVVFFSFAWLLACHKGCSDDVPVASGGQCQQLRFLFSCEISLLRSFPLEIDGSTPTRRLRRLLRFVPHHVRANTCPLSQAGQRGRLAVHCVVLLHGGGGWRHCVADPADSLHHVLVPPPLSVARAAHAQPATRTHGRINRAVTGPTAVQLLGARAHATLCSSSRLRRSRLPALATDLRSGPAGTDADVQSAAANVRCAAANVCAAGAAATATHRAPAPIQ